MNSILKNDCSQLSFAMYSMHSSKISILESFLFQLFLPGPWPLGPPPETVIATLATSTVHQLLAEDVSFYMKFSAP